MFFIGKKGVRLNRFQLFQRQSKVFLACIKRLFQHWTFYPTKYFVLEKRKLVYVLNYKCATSSILKMLLDDLWVSIRDEEINWIEHHIADAFITYDPPSPSRYIFFSIVREPSQRLVSAYVSKYKSDLLNLKSWKTWADFLCYEIYLFWLMSWVESLKGFVKYVIRIPDFMADPHFKSQYWLIFWSRKISQSDIEIFKLEELSSDIGWKNFLIQHSLAWIQTRNSTKKVSDKEHIPTDFLGKIKVRYKKDYNFFGY